jgi:hypothetical protein
LPSSLLFRVQWNWDSAIVTAGWAVFDEGRAWDELETLFADQWADGMVASINFIKFSDTYFPGPEIWGTPEKPSKTSGISQPPVAAMAARFLFEHAQDQALAKAKIEDLFPKLLAWHRWWYKVTNLSLSLWLWPLFFKHVAHCSVFLKGYAFLGWCAGAGP